MSDLPIIELPGLQLQTIEVGELGIQMPYQDKLTFVPGAYQADAIGTSWIRPLHV